MSVDKIRDYIEADSLGYLSLEGMIAATGLSPNSSCVACWNGQYTTRITREAETMWERDHESVIAEGGISDVVAVQTRTLHVTDYSYPYHSYCRNQSGTGSDWQSIA